MTEPKVILFMSVPLGYEEFYGTRGTRAQLEAEILRRPLLVWLNLLTRLAHTLTATPAEGSQLLQQMFLDRFFSDSQRRHLPRLWHETDARVIWSRQLRALVQLVLLIGDEHADGEFKFPRDRPIIGRALLLTTDLLQKRDHAETTLEVQLARGMLKSPEPPIMTAVLRALSVYRAPPHPDCDWGGFARAFEEATGLGLEMTVHFGANLLGGWMARMKTTESAIVQLSEEAFVGAAGDGAATPEFIRGFFRTLSDTVAGHRTRILANEGGAPLHEWFYRSMRNRPLLAMGDGRYLPLSFELFATWLLDGIFYTVRRHMEAKRGKGARGQVAKEFGYQLEGHCKRLALRAWPAGVRTLIAPKGAEPPDIILLHERTLLLIEIKTSRFSPFAHTRLKSLDKVHGRILEAAEQLSARIDELFEGVIKPSGFELDDIDEILPVIVTWETVPLLYQLRWEFHDRVEELGCFPQPSVRRVEAIDVGEWEIVSRSLSLTELVELLRARSTSEEGRSITLRNELYDSRQGVLQRALEQERREFRECGFEAVGRLWGEDARAKSESRFRARRA